MLPGSTGRFSITILLYSSSKTHGFFLCPHLFVFLGTSQADCGVGDINRKVHHPPWSAFLVCMHEHTVNLGDSIKDYHRDFCRENCLIWLCEYSSSQGGGARIQLHGSGASGFSNFSKTRAKPLTKYIIIWDYHYLFEFVRAWCVLWRLQWGERRQRRSAEVLNDPKGIWGADFDQIPVLNIWRYSPYHIFCFVGNATQVGALLCLVCLLYTSPSPRD